MARLQLLPWAVLVVFASCGPDSVADLSQPAADDLADFEGELTTAEVAAMLQVVNGPEGTQQVLWGEAQLSFSAADQIEGHVRGLDRLLGTGDDNPCDSVAELDAVPTVGAVALQRLATWATAHTGPGVQSVRGVPFTAAEARDVVVAANTVDLGALGRLSVATSAAVVARRPFTTLAQLGAVSQLSESDLRTYRNWAHGHPQPASTGPNPPCTGTGGTYDGVTFSLAQECAAAKFLNQARYSEMTALPTAARNLAYNGSPEGAWGFRSSRWFDVKTFSAAAGIGKTAITALKTASGSWSPNGKSYDTIAATWASRTMLNGASLFFDKVYVSKVFPQRQDGAWGWQCAELRDTPSASNYLLGCFQYIGADSSAGCQNGGCWDQRAGTFISVAGILRPSGLSGSGGFKVALSASGPGQPNPNLP